MCNERHPPSESHVIRYSPGWVQPLRPSPDRNDFGLGTADIPTTHQLKQHVLCMHRNVCKASLSRKLGGDIFRGGDRLPSERHGQTSGKTYNCNRLLKTFEEFWLSSRGNGPKDSLSSDRRESLCMIYQHANL